jgi:hypothetical protein
MINRSLTRQRLLRGAGILLVTLGIVHLLATPHIATLVRSSAALSSAQWLTPPMLLNHILVGVLLIPLGFLTAYAAPHAVSGASWARANHSPLSCSIADRSFRIDGYAILFRRAAVCLGCGPDGYRCGHIVSCCVRSMSLLHEASNSALSR